MGTMGVSLPERVALRVLRGRDVLESVTFGPSLPIYIK